MRKRRRVLAFLVARFTPGTYLGLHLTVGLLVCLSALWLFSAITEGVVNEPITRVDSALVTTIRAHATPTGDAAFSFISRIGSPAALAVIAVVVGIWLIWRGHRYVLTGWIAAFAGGAVVTHVLKIVIRRPRPPGAEAFLHESTFGFPSGHALNSVVAYGMLAYVLPILVARSRRTRMAVVATAALLVLAIGVSRMYLGVHYLSDVLAGYAVGVLYLTVCISGVETARRRAAMPRSLRSRSHEEWA
jgi:undecaprenyl-diphosphatase